MFIVKLAPDLQNSARSDMFDFIMKPTPIQQNPHATPTEFKDIQGPHFL